jgi:hypothetical protein
MKVDATVRCFSLDGKPTCYSYFKCFADDENKVFKTTPLEFHRQKYITSIDERAWQQKFISHNNFINLAPKTCSYLHSHSLSKLPHSY